MRGRIVNIGRHPKAFSVDEQRRKYMVYIDGDDGPCFEIRGTPKFEIGSEVEYDEMQSRDCPSGKKAIHIKFV